jgi:hemoglobin
MKKEIEEIGDIERLVSLFYNKVNQDDLLSEVFNVHAKTNWESHLPKMVQFWSGILLDTSEYRGKPFDAHAKQSDHISPEHFKRWIALFRETISENFEGEKAALAIQRAESIGAIFQYKLDFMRLNKDTTDPSLNKL